MSSPEKTETPFKRTLSDFVRNATSEEKERVYQEVMKKAWERQDRIIEKARNL
ncbi:hypothetical protein ACIQAL_04450 [Pseudomonas sp. NPDC088368]|jgi:hypothetical protein|uniref:hypothetical protein n=1 Tax=Pseudomonas sp. NPDC088368 TaxID=3364453 RepID=UPI00382A411C